MPNLKKVVDGMIELKRHMNRIAKIAETEYPVGTQISWERGRGTQYGTVEHFGFRQSPRFRVKNEATGKTYWIDFYDVVCAAGEKVREHYLDAA